MRIAIVSIIIVVIVVVYFQAKVKGYKYIYLNGSYSYDEVVRAGAERYPFSCIFIVNTRLRYLISLLIFFFLLSYSPT
jgi:hypothetical protein